MHPVFTLSSELDFKVSHAKLEEMHEHWLESIQAWRNAITGWVIGPGLGRDRHMESFFPKLIREINHNTLLILDADAIYYLSQNPDLYEELEKKGRVILTPNHK